MTFAAKAGRAPSAIFAAKAGRAPSGAARKNHPSGGVRRYAQSVLSA